MAEQTERAFQKQPTIFLNSKLRTLGIGKKSKKDVRYVRNVGLGFKTPREVSVRIVLIITFRICSICPISVLLDLCMRLFVVPRLGYLKRPSISISHIFGSKKFAVYFKALGKFLFGTVVVHSCFCWKYLNNRLSSFVWL